MESIQNILIIDDEPKNIRILEEALSDFAKLRSAKDSKEADAALKDFIPDLVLLDIMLPGVDGYEICRRFRANPKLAHARIILLSGKASIEERLMGYESGADDYVTKPFVPDELVAKAKVSLRLVAAEKKVHELNSTLEQQVRLRTEQLMGAEKAAYIGMHTSEIIHNLNNPLAILMANASLLEEEYPAEEKLKKISSALQRMHETIKSILQSSRQAADHNEQLCDINQILQNELKLLEIRKSFKNDIQLKLDLGQIPLVRGQPTHFSQSLGNLLKNAAEAMYGCEKKELRVRSSKEGNGVVVEISDSGVGIPRSDFERIFDPFFTTKPLQAKDDEPIGTGLGLASVKRMLDAYGAELKLESELGKGTTVKVILPCEKSSAKNKTGENSTIQKIS